MTQNMRKVRFKNHVYIHQGVADTCRHAGLAWLGKPVVRLLRWSGDWEPIDKYLVSTQITEGKCQFVLSGQHVAKVNGSQTHHEVLFICKHQLRRNGVIGAVRLIDDKICFLLFPKCRRRKWNGEDTGGTRQWANTMGTPDRCMGMKGDVHFQENVDPIAGLAMVTLQYSLIE